MEQYITICSCVISKLLLSKWLIVNGIVLGSVWLGFMAA